MLISFSSVPVDSLCSVGLKVDTLMVLCRRLVCSLIRNKHFRPVENLFLPASLHQ